VAYGGVWRKAATALNRRRLLTLCISVIGIAAAGVIAGIVTSGSSGSVTYTVVTPAALGPYQSAPDLGSDMPTLESSLAAMSNGQASDIRARTYEKQAPGDAATQILEVLAGHLLASSSASPTAFLAQINPGAHTVPAGPMGGAAACTGQTAGTTDGVAICAWNDSGTFGIFMSTTLNSANLANLMEQDRPRIELVRRS
jgi:hypothetical protein